MRLYSVNENHHTQHEEINKPVTRVIYLTYLVSFSTKKKIGNYEE